MKNAILVMMHLLARLAVLLGTGGTRAVLAENILLKQQLMVLQRSRRRAPNLRTADRWLFGFCAQFVSLRRLIRTAIILKPNGTELTCNLGPVNYLRFCTPGSFFKIFSSVISCNFATVTMTRRLASMASLAASY